MKNLLTLVFLLMSIGPILVGQSSNIIKSPLWTELEPGPYDVGFKVLYLVDPSRVMVSTDSLPHALEGRPVRVKMYYPGRREPSSLRMKFFDQTSILPRNPQFATYNTILNQRDQRLQGQFSPRSDSLEQILFNTATMSFYNIPDAQGKFPLLIYELGLDDHQMENSVLWEYLASHGYVVAVLPSFGENMEDKYVQYTKEGAMLLYGDALYAMNHIAKQDNIDLEKIGAIGHSFGGLIVNVLAKNQNKIKAIASLDGSINMVNAQPLLPQLGVNDANIRIPVLNLYTVTHEVDVSYANSLSSPKYQVEYKKASHFDFQNWPLYAVITNTPDGRGERRRSMQEGLKMYLSVVSLTKSFFDFTLKKNMNEENYINELNREVKKLGELAELK